MCSLTLTEQVSHWSRKAPLGCQIPSVPRASPCAWPSTFQWPLMRGFPQGHGACAHWNRSWMTSVWPAFLGGPQAFHVHIQNTFFPLEINLMFLPFAIVILFDFIFWQAWNSLIAVRYKNPVTTVRNKWKISNQVYRVTFTAVLVCNSSSSSLMSLNYVFVLN